MQHFKEDPQTPVEVDRRVLEDSAWIFLVSHPARGEWKFLPVDHEDDSVSQRTTATLGQLILLDSTLESLADLPTGWHAWRQGPEEDWERARIPTGPTFLISYEVSPTADNPEASELAGAFVNAWVRCSSLSDAKKLASTDIEASGWRIIAEESTNKVERSLYDQDADSEEYLAFFDQAQIDGAVFVYHTYPRE